MEDDGELLPTSPGSNMLFNDLSLLDNFVSDSGFDFDLDLDFDIPVDDILFAENLLADPDSESNSATPEQPLSGNISDDSLQPNLGPGSTPIALIDGLMDDQCINADFSRNCEQITVSNFYPESGNSDRGSDSAGDLNYRLSGTNLIQKSDCASLESGSCNQESSHGFGECNSGVSRAVNSSLPDSGQSDHDDSSCFQIFPQGYSESKEEDAKDKCISKRKKEQDDVIFELRSNKLRRSSTVLQENYESFDLGNEGADKRKARLMRNRESAQLSRQRKKHYVKDLEDKVRSMHSTITDLNSRISFIVDENASLRQQLAGAGSGAAAGVAAHPPLPPAMYPMVPSPMGYPWFPYPPYVVKPHASNVPLVPIPRLKPQQPASYPRVNKKLESKKSEGKTKKVASISLLGFLFFMLLFGGLVPIVNVRFGGFGGRENLSRRFSDSYKGRVLTIDGLVNPTDHGGTAGLSGRRFDHRGYEYCKGENCQRLDPNVKHGTKLKTGTDGYAPSSNGSEPLVASLYVPRNDKLPKIDGSLIINSVMATEKARASRVDEGRKTSEETRLAVAQNYVRSYHISGVGRQTQLDRDASGRHKALASGSAEELNSPTTNGKLQQWFSENLAGSMLSSGMCTEVFQFNISPTPGAIIPAASIATNKTSSGVQQNSSQLNKTRNRRFLHRHPVPLHFPVLNSTQEQVELNKPKEGFLPGNSSHSSMVVTVLVDPREAGDIDSEGVMHSKSLSRIFVVLLIDSVKYVTYSCVLPRMTSGPHLVPV